MSSPASSLRIVTVTPEDLSDVFAIADVAHRSDGADPLNEQTRLDLASGRRTAHVGFASGTAVAAASTGDGELDLVVTPADRGRGYGSALLEALLPDLEPDVSAWSHGDHPTARALAASHGFERVRTLLRLRLPSLRALPSAPAEDSKGQEQPKVPTGSAGEPGSSRAPDDGIRVTAFDRAADASDWLALNARAFADHPEQGRMTRDDLAEREAEPWFDPQDFLIARDPSGRMVGFHWMKREPGSDEGEVYVLGVDPDAAGRGLGRFLLTEGLRRLRDAGVLQASLYVEGDNRRALALYRRMGFVNDAVDVQYWRASGGRRPPA